jgi:steroid 5-alpha reductase family enzyme
MAAVHVLDNYYLSITWLITVAYQLFFFAIAFSFKFDKLTDFAGGTNFVVLAIITLAFSAARDNARNIVCSVFIMLWGLRLSGFLLFRILKTGKDDRFDDKRDKFFSFLGFWVAQMVWVWAVSLPVTILNSPNVTKYGQPKFGTGRDIAGVILFSIGLIMESVSDVQKYLFRSKHKESGAVCDVGLFKFTRHPNYFGEIIIQFGMIPPSIFCPGLVTDSETGIFMIAVSPAAYGYTQGGGYKALYASILGPFFLTILLLFVSGLTLQERPGAKKRYEKGTNWPAYAEYLHRTSILIPFPPQVYSKLPVILKRILFLEFPIYVFDPAKHADAKSSSGAAAEEGRAGHQEGDGQPLRQNGA